MSDTDVYGTSRVSESYEQIRQVKEMQERLKEMTQVKA